jgi:transcription elongation factor GreA-like protein
MQKPMKQMRTIAEFWSPLFAQAGDIFDFYLSNLTKLKTTFGCNLLYWML